MLTLQPVRGIIRVMKSRQRTRNTKLISLYMTVILSGILIGCNAETGQTEQEQVDLMAAEAQKQAEKAFHEMLKPILNMLDTTDNLETLREVLKDKKEIKKLYEQMDSPELEDILHQAIYLSELMGRSME